MLNGAPSPPAGLILVPIKTAANAEVRFCGRAPDSLSAPCVQGQQPAAPPRECERRAGYVSSAGWTLHDQTYAELAWCAVNSEQALHEWVAAECDRTQRLPEAFKEVWARIKAGESWAGEEWLDNETASGPGSSAQSEMIARLRRQVRHSMHVMMQEDNPDSYYSQVKHMTPT